MKEIIYYGSIALLLAPLLVFASFVELRLLVASFVLILWPFIYFGITVNLEQDNKIEFEITN